ncbi:ABC transporter ATP-binding protein [Dactylosporangium sp. NPDC051484]|uniref:ABC transporter ATP-binding protein n=1 Tax=Dactylosporangium sp. NPDC051484 TaxID=3154942 RepID=UPI00344F8DE7
MTAESATTVKRGAALPEAALELRSVSGGYGTTTVLHDVSFTVPRGQIVALLGPNGAGKTTLLRTASGLLRPSAGTIAVNGTDLTTASAARRAKAGLCLIPEGRGIWRSLTVRENLRLQVPKWATADRVDEVIEMFPILQRRINQVAGTMSGGEQQMLALSRAFLSQANIVLLDEVSMGLAPRIVEEIFQVLQKLAATGAALLLVEQYVTRALAMADRVVMLHRGAVAFDGLPSELDEDAIVRGYLGVGAAPGEE